MAAEKFYHVPQGVPCALCGHFPFSHRVDHKPDGDPCKKCNGIPGVKHRWRPSWIRKARRKEPRVHKKRIDKRKRTDKERRYFIGLDGEGQGRKEHKYIMLCASNEDGSQKWVEEAPEGERLRTVDCLEMLLSLPTRHTKIFTFAFNYDLTKMLTDVDDRTLYLLFRPHLRPGYRRPRPLKWGDYRFNLQGTKFTLIKDKKRVVIWDLFKFFASKFVKALKAWQVGNPEAWKRMQTMKDKRNEFDKETRDDVRNYCLEECRYIAELARKLIDSHDKAGLQLRSYYGAGSSGGAMLTAMGIREKIKPCIPEMRGPVSQAFFGGRFEHNVIGAISGPLDGWDISSAYPYQTTFLPCQEHGFWKHTTRRKDLNQTRHALVRYGLSKLSSKRIQNESWAPFPYRIPEGKEKGSIAFPIQSGGGWVWRDEYLAGEKLFDYVEFKEAWVYDCQCECQPFAKIPGYYLERILLGKDGPGLVLKLGCNSCYGKLAQSVGSALFNSYLWAGMITSGCRAQILELFALHKDMNNILAVATDGVYTREIGIVAPTPKDTGTFGARKPDGTAVPLGGWERKRADKGLFFARPGIYFPLDPTEAELDDIKGRGVGKGTVLENWRRIVDTWNRNGIEGIAKVANVSRFCGAKTSITYNQPNMAEGEPGGYKRASAGGKSKYDGHELPAYGQWVTRRVELSFIPTPKRECLNRDGMTLKLRAFDTEKESLPYARAVAMQTREAIELLKAREEIEEQPDGDLADYELEEQ